MKKLLIPILFFSALWALYEQSSEHPNIYLMVAAIVVFMLCMMKLSSRIPPKNKDKEDNDNV